MVPPKQPDPARITYTPMEFARDAASRCPFTFPSQRCPTRCSCRPRRRRFWRSPPSTASRSPAKPAPCSAGSGSCSRPGSQRRWRRPERTGRDTGDFARPGLRIDVRHRVRFAARGGSWRAHVHFDRASRVGAAEFRDVMPAYLGSRVEIDRSVPIQCGGFQGYFRRRKFAKSLAGRRPIMEPLDVFAHPNSGNELSGNRDCAIWIGHRHEPDLRAAGG